MKVEPKLIQANNRLGYFKRSAERFDPERQLSPTLRKYLGFQHELVCHILALELRISELTGEKMPFWRFDDPEEE